MLKTLFEVLLMLNSYFKYLCYNNLAERKQHGCTPSFRKTWVYTSINIMQTKIKKLFAFFILSGRMKLRNEGGHRKKRPITQKGY